jgi:hypothetical protein
MQAPYDAGLGVHEKTVACGEKTANGLRNSGTSTCFRLECSYTGQKGPITMYRTTGPGDSNLPRMQCAPKQSPGGGLPCDTNNSPSTKREEPGGCPGVSPSFRVSANRIKSLA